MAAARTIRHIVRKEFLQLFRDRRMIAPLFIAPVLQLILFGYAATVDVKHIDFVIVDQSRTADSRDLASLFTKSGYFDLRATLGSAKEAEDCLQSGRAKASLVIPADFAKRLARGEAAPVQVLLDGSDANSATIIQNYVALIMARFQGTLLARAAGIAPGALNAVEPRVWYNPEFKSSFWMVPGVISMVLILSTLVMTAMAITKEREIGTLEQLIVSPIRPAELIVGKMIPFVVVGCVDIVLVLTAARIVFGIPLRGSMIFLFAAAFIFILTTLGIGLFISTVSRTQGQVIQSAMFFMMPAFLLSGIFSPIESMPKLIRAVTYLNPMRYFGRIVRDVLLKGSGWAILWPEVVVLFVMGVLIFTLSSLRFKKRLG